MYCFNFKQQLKENSAGACNFQKKSNSEEGGAKPRNDTGKETKGNKKKGVNTKNGKEKENKGSSTKIKDDREKENKGSKTGSDKVKQKVWWTLGILRMCASVCLCVLVCVYPDSLAYW